MKIKLDENLPASLAGTLHALGHDVDTVPEEGLAGFPDPYVWAETQAAGRFFVTQDLDFSNIHDFPPGTHAGVLIIRLLKPSRATLFDRVRSLFAVEDVESWRGCLVIASDLKVRVRRAAPQSPP